MYNVYQPWDPLKVCVVGRSYPPEFYSWIDKPAVRSLFEKIAVETEEDFQGIIKKLESFGVEVLRPNIPVETATRDGFYIPPPMTPRDNNVMIGEDFYTHNISPKNVGYNYVMSAYDNIFTKIKNQGNQIKFTNSFFINGAMVSRIGKDLYFGTIDPDIHPEKLKYTKNIIDNEFPNYRNHFIHTGGHSDGVYCPVCPGLIISLHDVPTYTDTFPDWEVVYLPNQSWLLVEDFLKLKRKNGGKWWIPGFEHDDDVVDTVEQWLGHWTGYVEETVFDVNMLVVDPKNVLVFNYNKQVFDALERYGITPHIVPFRHRYFWDGGIHCVTSDLHREGTLQNFFPLRP